MQHMLHVKFWGATLCCSWACPHWVWSPCNGVLQTPWCSQFTNAAHACTQGLHTGHGGAFVNMYRVGLQH